MLRGLANISYFADDVDAAVDWYRTVTGVEPYFKRPEEGPAAYVEFRVGDLQHEVGIVDRRYAAARATAGPGGVVTYWHVDDVRAAHQRLLDLGATSYEPVTERGEGFVTASVVDPFGNVLGIMENPHYLDVLAARTAAG
jgi:predicted enzyme related to lactoylglutathione lyase